MAETEILDPEHFLFRGLHPDVSIGTASDRYVGWIGQIYSEGRYRGRITRRSRTLGDKSFVEEVLPVESAEEFFRHFRILEIDFTFYRPLLEKDGKPTTNHRVIQSYRQHMRDGDALILKVPQTVCAQKMWQAGRYAENPEYLSADCFTRQFYEPAVELLGPLLGGFVFEQEYQRREGRIEPERMAESLDAFFRKIPKDSRYHFELRTDTLLVEPVFSVFREHGVGQVLSHWTWLPSLRRQFSLAGREFFNAGNQCVLRLMTPRNVRYEEAYARAHPFNAIVDGMLDPRMIEDAAALMQKAVQRKIRINVIVNNRAGGNAPLISRQLVERFLNP
ncbi:MAG: DUF72 domain-containing protein [bacterium]